MNKTLLPGKPFLLGATVYPKGVNFALYSQNAIGVELCLYNPDNSPGESFKLTERIDFIWHCFVENLKPFLHV